ncbi:metal ABC transporter solute-binding protein, Zn/Mn family [Halobacillus salinus]|uniref:metal ABC transporter solute-binding protein, Zn/Mn family n=1 Tax=Halobacillus salinus TaxID=192814 RepID=UPI0009A6C773|nr:zinc ABC transporter substrate-binding protein [Halobacillus salinus]
MKRVIVLLFTLMIVTACSQGNEAATDKSNEDDIHIYTTVYPIQYFTEQIAGDMAQVESILPPGTDPHSYEPTTKEMIEFAGADAFIYNGAGLEGYAKTISDTIETEGVDILEASAGVPLEEDIHSFEADEGQVDEGEQENHNHDEEKGHDGHQHGENDPHLWLDPLRSIQMADNIRELLVEIEPEEAETFNHNFERLKQKLEDLDHDYHKTLGILPKDDIIVSHAAYSYWEKAYGLNQIPISGVSPSNEPSQKEVESIIETAEKHELNHILFEQNITPKVANVVKNEIGAESLRIHNLSVLTEEDIENEDDYFTLMRENLAKLKEALSE